MYRKDVSQRWTKSIHNHARLELALRLVKERSQCKNWENVNFLSVKAIERVTNSREVVAWARHRFRHYEINHFNYFIERIRNNFSFVFAGLILAKLDHLTLDLMNSGLDNTTLFDEASFEKCCYSAGLNSSEKQKLVESRRDIGVVLEKNQHVRLPNDVKLPYKKRESTGKRGAFGIIFKNEVEPGHLRGLDEVR